MNNQPDKEECMNVAKCLFIQTKSKGKNAFETHNASGVRTMIMFFR